jgi:hypothetical protein
MTVSEGSARLPDVSFGGTNNPTESELEVKPKVRLWWPSDKNDSDVFVGL